MKRFIAALAAAALSVPAPAFAWGAKGHTLVNFAGAAALPASLPSFLHDPQIIAEIGELGPEEDRIKGAGKSWDSDNDEAHFLDMQDDGTVAGVVRLDALPESYQAYSDALAKAGTTPSKQGWLPYAIIDGWERVRKDFAYYRVEDYLAAHAASPDEQKRHEMQRAMRQLLLIRDIGDWGHFVADGSQPLHVTIHFNDHNLHSKFETAFVNAHVSLADVNRHMAPVNAAQPQTLLTQADIANLVGNYLLATGKNQAATYALDSKGAFDAATPEAVDFTATQLARGADEFRDLITLAWNDSLNESVGYPYVKVKDVLSGTALPKSDG